ncbi:hypothetical protein HPB51_000101 [Rhipicephalus microplus]|uniref:Uncharacterized protein n=1 Tax=Rhipicephalus microplus TaxID=6941 RepID=A0A9J6EKR7_RHIMP|nr:hypothetical protein HPB51_000101 [Rhipicephalus microplus]
MTRKSRTVALCCLANFVNAADRVLMPIAIVPMSEQYRWSLLWQGWILSAFAVGYITSQHPFKYCVSSPSVSTCHSWWALAAPSRYGGRTVMAGAVLLWSASTLVTPLVASSLPLLLLCRALLGLGEGLGLPCMFHVVGQAAPVPEERTRAVALCAGRGCCGTDRCSAAVWMVLHRDEPSQLKEPTKVNTVSSPHWLELISHWPLWAIYIAHFAMNWSSYTIMQWLPTYLARAAELAGRQWSVLSVHRLATSCLGLLGPGICLLAFSAVGSLPLALFFVSCAMGLLACNSAGHLANHADVAPTHAALTFSVSNTLATIPGILCGPLTAELVTQSHGRWFPVFVLACCRQLCRRCGLRKPELCQPSVVMVCQLKTLVNSVISP